MLASAQPSSGQPGVCLRSWGITSALRIMSIIDSSMSIRMMDVPKLARRERFN